MSFILDALKKSEQERDRQQQPAVVDIPYGRRSRGQPVWLLVVIALLVLNCILLLVMWWRSGNQNETAPVATAVPATAPESTPAPRLPPARATDVRPLQDEAGGDATTFTEAADETTAALSAAPAPEGAPLVRSTTPLEQAMAQQHARVTTGNGDNRNPSVASDPGVLDNTPTLASLGGSGALNLPDLRLDIHVYSPAPAERFAFINGRKYGEGQNLSEGPSVERITKDGVILGYRGKRFVLPRQ